MKSRVWILLSLFVLAIGLFAVADAAAKQDEGKLIEKFNQKLDKLADHCVSKLEKAKSIATMDAIAQGCEAEVFALLDELEAKLDHAVDFVPFHTCVYNEDLNYTACFDPINIVG